MAIIGYLRIPDIPGESLIAGHEDEIDVIGLHWGVSRPGGSGSGVRRRRPRPEPLTAIKWVDRATPYLASAVARGVAFDEIVLTLAREGGDGRFDYLTLGVTNCALIEHEIENDGFDDPAILVRERVVIAYEEVRILYREQSADGGAGAEHEVEIDLAVL